MVIKTRYFVKFYKMLTDTSAFKQVKEYHLKGDQPLKAIPTYLDTLWCKIRYALSTKEYFYFSFYNKNARARRSYISSAKSFYTICNIINKGDKSLFDYKYNTYQAYKDYYRREAILVDLPSEADLIKEFAHKHHGFIMKPVNMSQGKGIRFWSEDMEQSDEKLRHLQNEVLGKVVIEEIIQQDPEMAAFHPSSVNTIRYVVDYHESGVDRLFAFIRIGVGDNKVDNTSAGGICAAIDLDTGIIVSKGLRRNGECFILHPDSGKQIVGTKIPRWEDLNEMIQNLRPQNSPVRLVGWDMALSKDGWCIVEGNWGPSIIGIQGCLDEGYRSVIQRVKKKCAKH